jgi:hypothetical protein
MKGYKTIVVNGALATLPVVDYVINNGNLIASITPHAATVMSVVGLINVILRWVTTTPVMKQE